MPRTAIAARTGVLVCDFPDAPVSRRRGRRRRGGATHAQDERLPRGSTPQGGGRVVRAAYPYRSKTGEPSARRDGRGESEPVSASAETRARERAEETAASHLSETEREGPRAVTVWVAQSESCRIRRNRRKRQRPGLWMQTARRRGRGAQGMTARNKGAAGVTGLGDGAGCALQAARRRG